jgi:hypothetical protein
VHIVDVSDAVPCISLILRYSNCVKAERGSSVTVVTKMQAERHKNQTLARKTQDKVTIDN